MLELRAPAYPADDKTAQHQWRRYIKMDVATDCYKDYIDCFDYQNGLRKIWREHLIITKSGVPCETAEQSSSSGSGEAILRIRKYRQNGSSDL